MSLTVEELDEIETTEGGRGLRQRLEAALAENRTLSDENVGLKSLKVIEEHGLSLVKPEDLAGVAAGELEEKARQIQEDRVEQQRQLARSVFEQKGLSGDELDAAVDDFLQVPDGAQQVESDRWGRVRDLAGAKGDPVGTTLNTDGMSATDLLIQAELAGKKK